MIKAADEKLVRAVFTMARCALVTLIVAGCTHNLTPESPSSPAQGGRAPNGNVITINTTGDAEVRPGSPPVVTNGSGPHPPGQCPHPLHCPVVPRCPAAPACAACPQCRECTAQPPAIDCPSGSGSDGRAPGTPVADIHTVVMNPASGDAFPWAALATVLGALVTGLFGFIQLLISKETKISEFRKDWIDGLRRDIAKYVSTSRLWTQKHGLSQKQQAARDVDLLLGSRSARVSIELRLRMEKTKYSESLLATLNEIQGLVRRLINSRVWYERAYKLATGPRATARLAKRSDKRLFVLDRRVEKLVGLLEVVTQTGGRVVKEEWRRVRRGELLYRAFAAITLGMFIVALVVATRFALPQLLHYFAK